MDGGEAAGTELRWRLSRHTRRLVTLALAGLAFALITGRPEFAGLAAPALLILAARRPGRPARVGVQVRLSTTRTHEGEPEAVEVSLSGAGEHDAELFFRPGEAIDPAGPTAASGTQARFGFTCARWGRRPAGELDIVLRDRWRLTEGHATEPLPTLDCYPRPAPQRAAVVLSRLPNRLGEHPVRTPGDGLEFAGVREYVPGDRQRRINWPASLRRGRLQVNTFAGERSQDVVLLLDAAFDAGPPGASAVDLALRAATGTARACLAARDRVGFVAYQAGGVRWLPPSLSQRQVYRMAESMLAGQRGLSPADLLRRLPRAALPPGALITVFSPLLSPAFIEAVRDLRERGFAIIVIDVLNAEPKYGRSAVDRLTERIWRLEQEAIRFSLRELGVPVVHWDGEQSLDLPLAPYTRRALVTRR
ncbi:MAG: DUF58 domain-containing protein [Actinobacteria bacterium]|nr:DUF58 domain-containing protein [Actinomycetota bacterium]